MEYKKIDVENLQFANCCGYSNVTGVNSLSDVVEVATYQNYATTSNVSNEQDVNNNEDLSQQEKTTQIIDKVQQGYQTGGSILTSLVDLRKHWITNSTEQPAIENKSMVSEKPKTDNKKKIIIGSAIGFMVIGLIAIIVVKNKKAKKQRQ